MTANFGRYGCADTKVDAGAIADDWGCGKVWLAEKKLLLDVLSEGNPELYKRAKEQVVG